MFKPAPRFTRDKDAARLGKIRATAARGRIDTLIVSDPSSTDCM